MAAVSANQLITARNPGGLLHGVVAANNTLYQGTLCFHDADGSGKLEATTASGTNKFGGIVKHLRPDPVHDATPAGAREVEYYTEGVFTLAHGGNVANTDVGKAAYATSNYDVTATSTSATWIGRIARYISTTLCEVDLLKPPVS